MADESDKNSQQQREESAEDEQPSQPSTSGRAERDRNSSSPPRKDEHSQKNEQEEREEDEELPPQPRRQPSFRFFEQPPTLTALAARAVQLARQFMQQMGWRLLVVPLGFRVLLVADKALSCVMQFMRYAGIARDDGVTTETTDTVHLPPKPIGSSLRSELPPILREVGITLAMAEYFFDLRMSEDRELVSQLRHYQQILQQLRMAPIWRPRVQTPGRQFQRAPEAAVPVNVPESSVPESVPEAAVPAPAPVQESEVSQPAESSSSNSSSESTTSLPEELNQPYYSPPRFSVLWEKREEKADEAIQEDEQKDSVTQEGVQQPTAMSAEEAERAAMSVGQPSTSASAPPEAAPTAVAGDEQRQPRRLARSFMFTNIFGVKLA